MSFHWKDLVSAARLRQMRTATELLDRWQKTVFPVPLLENISAFRGEKEKMAALLVDNHLGKLARRLRMLTENPGTEPELFLEQWADIHLFTHLWSRFDRLSEAEQLNLIYHSGPNITKKHLEKAESVSGVFEVAAVDLAEEENLKRRTVYLTDISGSDFFTLTDFSFYRQPFDTEYRTGDILEGTLIKYPLPGVMRVRIEAMKKKPAAGDGSAGQHKGKSASWWRKKYAELLKINPFMSSLPVICALRSVYSPENSWTLIDGEGQIVRTDPAVPPEYLASVYTALFYDSLPVMAVWTAAGFWPESYHNGLRFVPFGIENRLAEQSTGDEEKSDES